VEVAAGVAPDGSDAQLAAETLAHHIKSFIGTSARIELRPAGGIERSLGKARRVVDQRRL